MPRARLLPWNEAGWAHVAVARPHAQPVSRRHLSVLIAARGPLPEVQIPDLPWPERGLSVRTDGLQLVNVHSPISPSPGLAKVLTHEALHKHLSKSAGPRVSYRLDHVIVSEEVSVDSVTYLHEWRQAGLSDHSPLLAEMGWEAATATGTLGA